MRCRFLEGGVRVSLAGRNASRRRRASDGIAERSTSSISRALLLVFAVSFVAALVGTPAEVKAGDLATVSTDVLNVRSGPTLDAPVVTQAVWGEVLDVWSGPSDEGYYEVMYGDVQGYVSGAYIVFDVGVGGWSPPAVSGQGGEAVAAVSSGNRYVDVDRSSGLVTLYENGVAIYTVWGAMGWDQSDDGFYATANGTYYVYAREEGLTWTDWGRSFVTHYVAFDAKRYNGFHSYSLNKQGQLLAGGGNGPTGGCIAIAPWDIEAIYNFAVLGTRVDVHW